MKATLAALALAWLLSGCGGGFVFISFTSGTIEGDPSCRNTGGRFDLRDQGGLVLLVSINSDTLIFLGDGSHGTCRDLAAGAPVQVRGPRDGNRITAQSVTVR